MRGKYATKAERARRQLELDHRIAVMERREKRIEQIWEMAFDSEAAWLLHRYMTGTALRLMTSGRFEEADVLLELLPKKTARALLDSFFPEEMEAWPTTNEAREALKG